MIRKLFRTPIFRSLKFHAPAIYMFSQQNQDPKFSDEIMNKLKNQAQNFYDNIVVDNKLQHVDVIDADHFNQLVQESNQKIIIVYCFAQWSLECKEFKEVLIKNMEKYSDVSTIINIDIDKHPNLITQLQINSVPFAGVVYNNQFVDGYFKNGKFDRFMTIVEQISRILRGENVEQMILEQMAQLFDSKNYQGLMTLTTEALARDNVKKEHPKYLLFKALAYVLMEDLNKIQETLDLFDKQYKDDLEDMNTKQLYQLVQDQYKLVKQIKSMTPEIENILVRINDNPENYDLYFDLALEALSIKNNELAIKSLLTIVKKDKNWADKKAQKKLIEIFGELGNQHNLVIQGRKELGKLLN
ncbi:unnamed protein product (macronuclear) [Paramecium tetraurelia]|uniref:Thioredoxin domain-containing protein n=1 Tax=Paramecium tetraurelia TaxID=5888 RepID=A0BJ30_PARTE|nr:uncharacterized protein GSPATT00004920001 [Paramecium tetraurelia]CAK58547.1 unnamed protein product [Paramecium tetraurelia]|eukprot:XP_001425945.1 hypothetical protein (macronuclear) [Paramecium tetraurelia strain d4-2]